MSSDKEGVAIKDWSFQTDRGPWQVLAKHLIDTLELTWRIQRTSARLNGPTPQKIQSLFDGMIRELHLFSDMIADRLGALAVEEPGSVTFRPNQYWRLFAEGGLDLPEVLELLLCGCAHYSQLTSEAITDLRWWEDADSVKLLKSISMKVDRCLWFLDIYLEGLALSTDASRLPDWQPAAA